MEYLSSDSESNSVVDDDGSWQLSSPFEVESGENSVHSSDENMVHESGNDDNKAIEEAPAWPSGLEGVSSDFGKPMSRRLLHFGPISALSIILTIGLTSTILHATWWPIDTPISCLHLLIFLTWNYKVVSNFLKAAFVGGGFIPLEWRPHDEKFIDQLQYCQQCRGYKAPRSHHCSKCDRCVMKMDHHCPWINNCVGHRNQNYFIRFLFYAIVGCAHATIILSSCIWNTVRAIYYNDALFFYRDADDKDEPFIITSFYWFFAVIMSMSFAIGVFTALMFLLYIQLKIVYTNVTGIEEYICLKAKYRRGADEKPFIYPYDLGWRHNLADVWNQGANLPKGNGIWWPIRKGCTQFTFTVFLWLLNLAYEKFRNHIAHENHF